MSHAEQPYGRRYDDLPANVATGIATLDLCVRRWEFPTAYRLRIRSRIGAGAAVAITVSHNYYIDDGLGDGDRLVTLTTTLAGGVENEAYQVIEGVALALRVRVETVPSTPPATSRSCSNAAAVAEIR